MRSAVIVFPGSNCDRDLAVSLAQHTGHTPTMVWHKDADLPANLDLVAIPGGFSFGDYLRCGAIAAKSPIMGAVRRFVERGGHALGICNGFQVLQETGLLPGALIRNAGLKFVCKDVMLTVETTASPFTAGYQAGQSLRIPVAHHDGNFVTDDATLAALRDSDRIAFTYQDNPNGSVGDVAGVLSENRRVLGMMPHPERLADPTLGGTDGTPMFASLAAAMAVA